VENQRKKRYGQVRVGLDTSKHHRRLRGEAFRVFSCMLVRAYRKEAGDPEELHGMVEVEAGEWQERLDLSPWVWRRSMKPLLDHYVEVVRRGNQNRPTLYRILRFDADYEAIHSGFRSRDSEHASDRKGEAARVAQATRADLGSSRGLGHASDTESETAREAQGTRAEGGDNSAREVAREGAREAQATRAKHIMARGKSDQSDQRRTSSSSVQSTHLVGAGAAPTEEEEEVASQVQEGDLVRAFQRAHVGIFGAKPTTSAQDLRAAEDALPIVHHLPGPDTHRVELFAAAARRFLRDPHGEDDDYVRKHGRRLYVLANAVRLEKYLQLVMRAQAAEQAALPPELDEGRGPNPARPESFENFEQWREVTEPVAQELVSQDTEHGRQLVRSWWRTATEVFEVAEPCPWLQEVR